MGCRKSKTTNSTDYRAKCPTFGPLQTEEERIVTTTEHDIEYPSASSLKEMTVSYYNMEYPATPFQEIANDGSGFKPKYLAAPLQLAAAKKPPPYKIDNTPHGPVPATQMLSLVFPAFHLSFL